MLDLTFSLEGGEVVSRRLGISAAGVKDFRRPLDQIGRNFLKVFDRNFSSRGSLYDGWAPRKPRYYMGARVDTWPLMEKTGRMRRAFKADVTTTSLKIDNPTPYFVYHQSSKLPRTKLPRRVMMKIRRQDAESIVKEFQLYLVEVMRRAGTR